MILYVVVINFTTFSCDTNLILTTIHTNRINLKIVEYMHKIIADCTRNSKSSRNLSKLNNLAATLVAQ